MSALLTPRRMSLLQGVYYTITGLWPLLSMDTFLAVTGPKTDLWLVRTVALLITAIGIALLIAAKRNEANFSITILAVASAASLAWVDAYYALTGVIWPVYLLDTFPEVALIIGWLLAHWFERR
ncbi:MAG TPA: hypothetical protein VER03_19530 [Bryobacteraceae bacterium]|nr:hypothetical protein [Bryobacteraceae bacterium]